METIRNKMNQSLRINLKGGGSFVLLAGATAPIPAPGIDPDQFVELVRRGDISVDSKPSGPEDGGSKESGTGNTGTIEPATMSNGAVEPETKTTDGVKSGTKVGGTVESKADKAEQEITVTCNSESSAERSPSAESTAPDAGNQTIDSGVEATETIYSGIPGVSMPKNPVSLQSKKTGAGESRKTGEGKKTIPKKDEPESVKEGHE